MNVVNHSGDSATGEPFWSIVLSWLEVNGAKVNIVHLQREDQKGSFIWGEAGIKQAVTNLQMSQLLLFLSSLCLKTSGGFPAMVPPTVDIQLCLAAE